MTNFPPEWEGRTTPDIYHDIVDGADFRDPEEGVALSSAQVWGRLLRMGREEREKWFEMQQEASARGMSCFLHDHESLVEAYGLMNDAAQGYRIAAIAQKAEADEWHARFKRVLVLAHHWRAKAHEFLVDRDMRAARERQTDLDNEPCPKCGGDRLRTNFSGERVDFCHAPLRGSET